MLGDCTAQNPTAAQHTGSRRGATCRQARIWASLRILNGPHAIIIEMSSKKSLKLWITWYLCGYIGQKGHVLYSVSRETLYVS